MTKTRKYTKRQNTKKPLTKETSLGDKGVTGWQWIPVPERNTGRWGYMKNGVETPPSPFTTTDGSPFSRGGMGILENIWDAQVNWAEQTVDNIQAVTVATHSLFVNQVQPAISNIGDMITPSMEGPGVSIKEAEQSAAKQEQEELLQYHDELRLKWGK